MGVARYENAARMSVLLRAAEALREEAPGCEQDGQKGRVLATHLRVESREA